MSLKNDEQKSKWIKHGQIIGIVKNDTIDNVGLHTSDGCKSNKFMNF